MDDIVDYRVSIRIYHDDQDYYYRAIQDLSFSISRLVTIYFRVSIQRAIYYFSRSNTVFSKEISYDSIKELDLVTNFYVDDLNFAVIAYVDVMEKVDLV